MEALAISAANLDIIEKNLGSVANELSGVINNVNSVNSQVNKVEEKVSTLNNEVRNLVREIRETTTITNARQAIMYNNEQIDKKYGYYDKVRRTTESLLEAIESSSISRSALIKLREELLFNNPNYWLSNALAALISWVLDDKVNTEKELDNSIKKDSEKTSIFFSLVNLKLGRLDPSINWLKNYLDKLDPSNLNNEFVTILDLVSNGVYKTEGKKIVIEKINEWMNLLSQNKQLHDEEMNKWINFINASRTLNYNFPYLSNYSSDYQTIINNLSITSTYKNMLSYLDYVTKNVSESKNLNNIINNLIYEYEKKEQIFQKDNLKNRLIIECNGDRQRAEQLYKKQELIYNDSVNLITLLGNIVIFKNEYKVSNETQKFALSLIKNNILSAYDNINSNILENQINLKIDNFTTSTIDGTDRNKIDDELKVYLDKEYIFQDKFYISILIVVNIIGLIGIFLLLDSVLSAIIGVIVGLTDVFLIFKIVDGIKLTNKQKKSKKEIIDSNLERVLAETVEYNNILKENKSMKDKLKNFLDSISTDNYIKSNGERNINIGE